MEQVKYGLHWFRRDLRVAGNRALTKNWRESDGRVVGVFCFDKKFLNRPDFSCNRFQFFLETLRALRDELRQNGSDLIFLDVGPQDAFPKLFKELKQQYGHLPTNISFGKDYEPFAIKRDKGMRELFVANEIKVISHRDHLLIEPHELSKKNSTESYQVYSPFARRWLQIFQDEVIGKRIQLQQRGFKYLENLRKGKLKKGFNLTWDDLLRKKKGNGDLLETYLQSNNQKVTVKIPPAGSLEALKMLKAFEEKIDEYGENRDFPHIEGTSKFSMFLKNGSLTVPQIISYFDLKPYGKKKNGRDIFFSELIWREFYYHVLYHNPRVEVESFLEQYKSLPWENDKSLFKAWKAGKTGYPIVDAGMRQLKETGWMHNRVRMIVASFLTKDLLIDWRWGEKYFMEQLLDGDLAPNNGGWQWAASTGCDPQPYFRIFNPWLQGKKFDPEGEYIKTYIPELRSLEVKQLHQPIADHKDYPSPIVDHHERRDRALELYKAQRSKD